MNTKNKFLLILMAFFITLTLISPIYAAKKSGPSTIEITTKDGFILVGTVDLPAFASLKKKVPLVIFLHSLGHTKDSWFSLPQKTKSLGYAVLTLDLRGHGESIIDGKARKSYWTNFKPNDFQKLPGDVLDTISYVKTSYPEINSSKIAIVGADIGANAAIIAASKDNKDIKTLILLSPTMEQKKLETPVSLVAYGSHPLLIMVSKRDKFAYYQSSELIKYGQGIKTLKVFPSGGNGTDLVGFRPESNSIILDWLKKNL